jgi:hypothetical protein
MDQTASEQAAELLGAKAVSLGYVRSRMQVMRASTRLNTSAAT